MKRAGDISPGGVIRAGPYLHVPAQMEGSFTTGSVYPRSIITLSTCYEAKRGSHHPTLASDIHGSLPAVITRNRISFFSPPVLLRCETLSARRQPSHKNHCAHKCVSVILSTRNGLSESLRASQYTRLAHCEKGCGALSSAKPRSRISCFFISRYEEIFTRNSPVYLGANGVPRERPTDKLELNKISLAEVNILDWHT